MAPLQRKVRQTFAMFVALSIGLACLPAHAEDGAEHTETIDGVLTQLLEYYTFPEVAEQMASTLRAKLAEGAYADVPEGPELAERLTRDLYAVARDGHIKVRWSELPLPSESEDGGEEPSEAELHAMMAEDFGKENYGIERVEVLPGNIGYYKLTMLIDPHFARERHGAAMTLLAGTDALILDFRDNRGAIGFGSVEAFASYFFDKPTHLADLHWREGNRLDRSETHDDIAGPAYLGRPVYLLTSRKTFSGGEAVASQLQEQGRALIVGERTGGGANPGQVRRASAHYTVWVPNGKVSNALSGGNWEGTGVMPDIATPAQQALLSAHDLALQAVMERTPESDQANRSKLAEARAAIARQVGRFKPVEFELAGHADKDEVRVVADFNHWRGASLELQREGDRWVGRTELPPGSYLYRFEVDGKQLPDPANPVRESAGSRESSVLVVN